MVRENERRDAAPGGKHYARRPTSYKTSLTLKQQVATSRRRSPSPVHILERRRDFMRDEEESERVRELKERERMEKGQKRLAKMKKLKARYGDASSGTRKL